MLTLQLHIFSANYQGSTQVMQPTKGPENFEGLHAKFTCRNQNQGSQAIELCPTFPIQALYHRYQVRECLSATGSRTTNNVASIERMQD